MGLWLDLFSKVSSKVFGFVQDLLLVSILQVNFLGLSSSV